jgi:hypothetical protein
MITNRYTRPIEVVKPEFVVIQGAYELCCGVPKERPEQEENHAHIESFCGYDFKIDDTPNTSFSFGLCFNPDFEYVTDSGGDDWLKFQKLVTQWRIERGARSSITETVIMPAYQTIIGMGQSAVPLILAQLRSEGDDPDQWFWALQAITGENPVRPEDQGNFQKMAEAWLRWAERDVYAW